ncbi:hypothetical protein [Nonomuraea sp. NPDC023979]|uniref:hypothetical protein n=1 Tax=Nonomuraea sp. NPDC023979 TaxID=3154796 RepID=UPI0033F066BC
MNESTTLRLGRGSCSRRMALLGRQHRSSCDLSGHVLADLGCFDSRDDLFDRHGQTLCLPVRIPADLIMSRRAA